MVDYSDLKSPAEDGLTAWFVATGKIKLKIWRNMKTFRIQANKATETNKYVAVAFSLLCPVCQSSIPNFSLDFTNQRSVCPVCKSRLKFEFYTKNGKMLEEVV